MEAQVGFAVHAGMLMPKAAREIRGLRIVVRGRTFPMQPTGGREICNSDDV